MRAGVASRAGRDGGAAVVGECEGRVVRVAEAHGWQSGRLNTARVRLMP